MARVKGFARSRLLPGREIGPDDEKIASLLAAHTPLPEGDLARHERLGILNAHEQVYREIDVYSAIEVLQLTAKLNSIGYSINSRGLESKRARYARIFWKKPAAKKKPAP